MNEHRPKQIDREAAERLLRGDFAVPPDGSDALAGLLAAAAAPARVGELAGESAALTAFSEASRSAAISPPQAKSEFRARMAKFLTVKAAAAAIALTAFGGAALAAGALPATLTGPDRTTHQPTERPSVPVALPGPVVSPHPVGSPDPTPASTPPAMAGLCRSYLARLKKIGYRDASGKTHQLADEPVYAALLKAAGGRQKIIAHCLTVLSGHHGGQQGRRQSPPPEFPTKMPTWSSDRPSWPTQRSGDHDGH
jgi:hypothetical protein